MVAERDLEVVPVEHLVGVCVRVAAAAPKEALPPPLFPPVGVDPSPGEGVVDKEGDPDPEGDPLPLVEAEAEGDPESDVVSEGDAEEVGQKDWPEDALSDPVEIKEEESVTEDEGR